MNVLNAALIVLAIVAVLAIAFWGVPLFTREKPTSGFVRRAPHREHYGEPPGMIRAVHRNELGFRGWADMPGDYEGSSAGALSAYVERSA